MNENTITIVKLREGLQELERLKNGEEHELGKHKLGRILTVIDSSMSDPEQRKATKDLVTSIWWEHQRPLSVLEMNHSREAMLFEALTGDKLWKEEKPSKAQLAKRYNPFEDKLNK